MKAIACLAFLIFVYFQIMKWCPFEITWNYHMYFGGFVFVYVLIYYFMNYQTSFVYKMAHTMKNIDEKPLYDVNSIFYKENQMDGLKNNLAMKQGWRCMHCQNPILQKDINNYSINYIQPLQFGGQNNLQNLGVKCPTCSTFSPYK